LALGYNYFKRAQVLLTEKKQKHAQISDETLGSRPAFSLKIWSEDEWLRGRKAEIELFGRPLPDNRLDMEGVTADFGTDRLVVHPKRMPEAVADYALSIRLIDDSIAEYERHLQREKANFVAYLSHMNDMRAQKELLIGDKAYLEAIANPAQAAAKREEAITHYREARKRYETILLQSYVPPNVLARVFPPGVSPATIDQTMTAEQLDSLFDNFRSILPMTRLALFENGDTIDEYLRYLNRASDRIAALK
jgi:hypothetical protein